MALNSIKNEFQKTDELGAVPEMADNLKHDEYLKDFLYKSRKRLKLILDRLGWTEEGVFRNFNTNSRAHTGSKEEDLEPPLPASAATSSEYTVIIDQDELRKLLNDASVQIPMTFSELQLNFTPKQKLLIYDYVVERTGKCSEPEIQLPAFAEIVATKNREKKNRRKYRKSKPTHIEEVRGLVDLQMQSLHQYLQAEETAISNTKHAKQDRQGGDALQSKTYQSFDYKYKHCSGGNRRRSESRVKDTEKSGRGRHSRSRSLSKAINEREKRKRSRSKNRTKDFDRRDKKRKHRCRSRTKDKSRHEKRKSSCENSSKGRTEKIETIRRRDHGRKNIENSRDRVSRNTKINKSRKRSPIRETEREEKRIKRRSRSRSKEINRREKSRSRSSHREINKTKESAKKSYYSSDW